MPVEVISASQTGTSTSQTQPRQPAVPWSLQPGPTRVRGVGARLVGSGALRSWDVLWEGMSESVCGEQVLPAMVHSVEKARAAGGQMEKQPRTTRVIADVWGHRLLGAVGAPQVGEGFRRKSSGWHRCSGNLPLSPTKLREVPLQQVTSWPASSPTRGLLRCQIPLDGGVPCRGLTPILVTSL